jgi:hypothetical protein
MPLTMEDILLERRRKPTGIEYTPPELLLEDEREFNEIQQMIESYTGPTNAPTPVTTSPTRIYGDQLVREQQDLGRQMAEPIPSPTFSIRSAPEVPLNLETFPESAPRTRAAVGGIVGAGEAALSVGTGMVGGAIGLMGAAEQIARDIGTPSGPNYWKNLVDQSKKLSEEFTYAPKTEEGKRAIGAIAPVFDYLHWFSRRASEAPIARMFLNEDQREALAYAHEIVTMAVGGHFLTTGVRALGRNRVKTFQDNFVEASKEPSGGPATEKLLKVADEIRTKAETTPEIRERFSPERVQELRGKQESQGIAELDTALGEMERVRIFESDPTLRPKLREQGNAILDRLNENPDNIEYQTNAVSFFEKTRGSGDRTIEGIRSKINTSLGGIEEPPSVSGPFGGEAPTRPFLVRDIELEPSPTPAIKPSRKRSSTKTTFTDEPPNATDLEIINQAKDLLGEGKTAGDIIKALPELESVQLKGGNIEGVTLRVEGDPNTLKRVDLSKGGETTSGVLGSKELLESSKIIGEIRRESESTITETSKSPTRRSPSKRSAEEKIQALEDSNAYANREGVIKRIQDSLESGEDIGREIFQAAPGPKQGELAMINYNKLRAIARDGINSSNRRGVMDILKDIVALFDFDVSGLGSTLANVHLSHRQKMAAQRLSADAYKAGKSLNDYMVEKGVDPVIRSLYEDYLTKEMTPITPPSGVGPKNMRLDGDAMSNDPGKQVIERNIKPSGKLGPAIYGDEAKAFQMANTLSAPDELYGWEKPRRTAKKAGQPIHDMMFDAHDRAIKVIDQQQREMNQDLTRLERLLKYSDRREITKQIQEGNPASLKGKNRQVYDTLESGVVEYFRQAEEVRDAIGIDPLPNIVDPVEAMRAINAARTHDIHVNLATTPADTIASVIRDFTVEPMKQTLTQRALGISRDPDIFRQYAQFANSSIQQLNMAPLTTKLRDLVNISYLDMVKLDGSYYSIKENNFGLHKFINDWANFVDGVPVKPLKGFQKVWDSQIRKYNENMSWSMLSGNLRSAMIQPWSLISTMHKAGIPNTIAAVGDSLASVMGGGARAEAIARSDLLSSRKNSALFSSVISESSEGTLRGMIKGGREARLAVTEGRLRDFTREIAQIGMTGLEIADYESAIISWNTFKRQGEKLGLKGKELDRFADDGLVSTQASGARGDLSPVQRSALGRTITQFQSFTFTDWDFMLHEVLKVGKNASPKEVIGSVLRYAGIVAAFDTIAAAIGFDPPTPNPITAYTRSQRRGDSPIATAFGVANDLVAPYIPIFGGSRYGKGIGGPLIGTAFGDLPLALAGRPGSQDPLEPVSKLVGIPGSASWWRQSRGNQNRTVVERLLNYDPATQGGGGSLSSGLKSGLGRDRLKSGLK